MRISRIVGLLTLALVAHTAAAAAAPLTIVTEDYPPFNMPKAGSQEIVGISSDLLQAAFKKAGIAYSVALFPWARAYDMAQKDPNTCVYSTTRTPEREPLFKWAGPLVHNDWVLFGRADSPHLTSLADVKPYTVGGYQGDALTLYLQSQGVRMDVANADRLNPRKLAANRIDFWAAGAILGPYVAAREGVKGLVPALKIKETEMYLACNKAVPDDVVGKINGALKQLAADGTAAAIARKYQ